MAKASVNKMVRNLGHGVVAGTQHHHLDATGQCVARCQVVVSATQTHKLAQHSHTHARARTHTRTHTRAHALTQHSQHSQHTNSHTTHTHTITHYSLTTTHARTHASRPGATYPGFAVVGNRGNQNGLPFLTNVERPCACNWEVPEGKGDTKGGLVQRQGKEADNTKNMPRTQARVATWVVKEGKVGLVTDVDHNRRRVAKCVEVVKFDPQRLIRPLLVVAQRLFPPPKHPRQRRSARPGLGLPTTAVPPPPTRLHHQHQTPPREGEHSHGPRKHTYTSKTPKLKNAQRRVGGRGRGGGGGG